jgi:hypothetical protein
MIAAAATLFWSQFGRPQPDDECSGSQLVLGSIPAMNAAAATIFWSQFWRPRPEIVSNRLHRPKTQAKMVKTLHKITAKMAKTTKIYLKNNGEVKMTKLRLKTTKMRPKSYFKKPGNIK